MADTKFTKDQAEANLDVDLSEQELDEVYDKALEDASQTSEPATGITISDIEFDDNDVDVEQKLDTKEGITTNPDSLDRIVDDVLIAHEKKEWNVPTTELHPLVDKQR